MASSNVPDVPLQQIQFRSRSLDGPVSLLDTGEVLIPVELPERPTEAISDSSHLVRISTSAPEAELTSLRRRRPSTPGSPLTSRQREQLRESSASPQSDTSRRSEESVLIVGDIFAAPTGLKFSLAGAPHVKNAGAFDRYGRPSSQSSGSPFPPSISFARRRTEPIIPVTPPMKSPKTRQRPLPTPPNNPPHIRSPFMPALPTQLATPTVMSPSTSMNRSRMSPAGPRPRGNSMSSEGTTRSARRRRRKRGSTFSPEGRDISDAGMSPQFLQPSFQASVSGMLSPGGLNPLAAVFEPGDLSKPRSSSLPGGPLANVDDRIAYVTRTLAYDSTNYYDPIQPNPVNPFPSMSPVPYQNVAHIQQDLPHLRQWSSLFRNEPLTLAEQREHFMRLQLQLQYEQQRLHHQQQFAAYTLGQPRDGFGTIQGLPVPYSQQVPQSRQGSFSQPYYTPQEAPSMTWDSRRSSYAHHSSSSGSSYDFGAPIVTPSIVSAQSSMLDLTPVQLPEARPARIIQPMISPLDTSVQKDPLEHSNPPPRVPSTNVGASKGPNTNTSGTPKGLGSKLTERGTSSLTPVTERSEVSSANVSTSLTPDRAGTAIPVTPSEEQKGQSKKKAKASKRNRKRLGLIQAKLAGEKAKGGG